MPSSGEAAATRSDAGARSYEKEQTREIREYPINILGRALDIRMSLQYSDLWIFVIAIVL